MGCGGSKHVLDTVDDSVHVLLAHDKKMAKKRGENPNVGYVPRAEHPLLKAAREEGEHPPPPARTTITAAE
jgi:hypothetical protein